MTVSDTSPGCDPAPAFEPMAATPESALDEVVGRLKDNARAFAQAPVKDKVRWLREVIARAHDEAPASIASQCRAKGIDPRSPVAAEEWFGGPGVTIRNMRLLVDSLEDIDRHGAPQLAPRHVRARDEGGVAVQVIPHDAYDRMLFAGITCETWLQPGVTPRDVAAHQASFYQREQPEGGVVLVLGAGNVASIPPMDVLSRMFVLGKVCVLKMNPVNEYLGPHIEHAFRPLIERGYLAVVYGGAEVGAYLCHHHDVDEIHITGSNETHDRIVWGPPGPERESRRRSNAPLLAKPMSSELGNVSPVIVVPGPYDDAEMDAMAHNIAGMVVNNASFNCNAAKMLILPTGWDRNDELLRRLAAAMGKAPPRKAYYPGAHARYVQLTRDRDALIRVGAAGEGELPWTIVPGLDASCRDDPRFSTEPFCAILSQTDVGSADPLVFLDAATRFANDTLWGTLSAMVFVHPATEADPVTRAAFDAAIRDLRYGSIGINLWAAFVYGLSGPPWGGHPGATLERVQSGIGWVHNTPMFERIEKSVVRGRIRPFPKLPTYPGHRSAHVLARRMTTFEAQPSWWRVPALASAALRG